MTTIRDITQKLESIAPLHLQESYDNAGLLVGNEHKEVKKILITLDITPEVVKEAIDKGCELIVAHHPIIFKGLKKITGSNYVEQSVLLSIKNDIGLYAAHTNLDNIKEGVNKRFSELLRLTDLSILAPRDSGEPEIGSGIIGKLPHPQGGEEFLAHLKKSLNLTVIKHTAHINKKIEKVALCGGSGSFLLNAAIAAGADAYISADFKYHEFFDAENKLMVCDVGHYESEVATKDIFLKIFNKNFTNIASVLSEVNTNPISYFI